LSRRRHQSREQGAAGSVPELRVDNVGARAVLVVDGEELVDQPRPHTRTRTR